LKRFGERERVRGHAPREQLLDRGHAE
jgi:hypothetical protein